MKKIPHKGEVYPKVEMEGSSTPKIVYAQSRFPLRSSNSRTENEKRTASAGLKWKTSFNNRASVLEKEIVHAISLNKSEAWFCLLS